MKSGTLRLDAVSALMLVVDTFDHAIRGAGLLLWAGLRIPEIATSNWNR